MQTDVTVQVLRAQISVIPVLVLEISHLTKYNIFIASNEMLGLYGKQLFHGE